MTKVDIKQKVSAFIRRENLIEQGEHVFLALSGGGDSVALFRLLLTLQDEWALTLSVGHFNHQLRDRALRDEDFARALCAKHAVDFYTGTGDVAAFAKKRGFGIEEAARNMRYAWLSAQAETIAADKILTGHHADDNVETVLLHLVRGGGTRGLSGIPPRRGRIVRPLLCVTREEIEIYLQEIGQDVVQDETNENTVFRRNLIRQDVLPILKTLNPNLGETVLRSSRRLRQDASYLDALAEAFLLPYFEREIRLENKELNALHIAVRSRVFRQAAAHFDSTLDDVHVRELETLLKNSSPSARICLPNDLLARREYDDLVFTKECSAPTGFSPVFLPEEGEVSVPEFGLRFFMESGKCEKIENFVKNKKFYFQKEAICGRIMLGSRKSGDKIRIYGREGTKTMKKWMMEEKIPAHQRDSVPVFYDEAGPIAIVGIGIADRVAPKRNDEIVIISWEDM